MVDVPVPLFTDRGQQHTVEQIVDVTLHRIEFPVLHKSGARIVVVLNAMTRRGLDDFQQYVAVKGGSRLTVNTFQVETVWRLQKENPQPMTPTSQVLGVPVHRLRKKLKSASRLIPKAHLGAYPRADRRRASASDLEKIVELMRLTSATADRRRPRTTGHESNCAGCPVFFPGARHGEYHQANCRCTSTSGLEEIVLLVSLTSATADCRIKCGCAYSSGYGENVEVTSIRVSIVS